MTKSDEQVDVVIVGAGPAGLTAARELRTLGVQSVVVLEREAEPGGVPRHSNHLGYGVRDRRRAMSGPRYARVLTDEAAGAGADVRTRSMVTGWAGDRDLWVTSPVGRYRVQARAIILATGARERPRTARLVPGDRPAGVLTTGLLQNLAYTKGRQLGGKAVVVGAELVSWSAVLTLRHAGCQTTLMATPHERPESYAPLTLLGRLALSVPVSTRTEVTRIIGHKQVQAVQVTDLMTGNCRTVPCDWVVFTGGWVPDQELARLGGLELDSGHRGPVVDMSLRTSVDGVFAAGNLLHPVDTADVASLDGRHVARQVHRHLAAPAPRSRGVRIRVDEPFAWVSPSVIDSPAIAPPRSKLLLWPQEFRASPIVEVRQGSTLIASRRVRWSASPGRVFRIPWSMFDAVDPAGGDLVVSMR